MPSPDEFDELADQIHQRCEQMVEIFDRHELTYEDDTALALIALGFIVLRLHRYRRAERLRLARACDRLARVYVDAYLEQMLPNTG